MSGELINQIFREREWSWSLIGLMSILLGLAVRSLFLKDVLRSMKIRNKSWYKRTLTYYQKKSLLGWIFFALFILGIILLWRMEQQFLKYFSFLEWFLCFLSLFFLSIFFHLRAYTQSIIEALQENMALDKEL